MLAALFLFSGFFNGILITRTFFPKVKAFLPLGFFAGSTISVTFLFILLLLTHNLQISIEIYFIVSAAVFLKNKTNLLQELSLKALFYYGVTFALAFLIFEKSFLLSGSTFLIQSNLYQDFGAHIPIIRYFSSGSFLPEVPFFAGKNLFYHFMFDFYAGVLEFLGMRIDIALNIISAFSIASLFSIIVSISKQIFKNVYVGIVACVLFIFNSDFSFIDLFNKYGLSWQGIVSIYHHNAYPTAGNFLNINVYLNQRQLIFGILAFFSIFYLIFFFQKIKLKQILFISTLIGFLPFWHVSAVVSVYLFLVGVIIFVKEYRREVFLIVFFSLVLVLPQLYLIKLNSLNQIVYNPGFLISNRLSISSFTSFWVWNLGFAIPLCVYGFFKSEKLQRRIFLAFLPLFIIPNLFQFSRDMFDNHKFFNIWIVTVCIFSAYGFIQLLKQKMIVRTAGIVLIVFTMLSGLFHLLVVKNDVVAKIPDTKNIGLVKYFNKDNSILLTNGEIYDPLSIAGFRTFLGRPHYIYLYGGDPSDRLFEKETVFEGKNKAEIKKILKDNKIRYIIIYKNKMVPSLFPVNIKNLNKNYKKTYEDNFATVYKMTR